MNWKSKQNSKKENKISCSFLSEFIRYGNAVVHRTVKITYFTRNMSPIDDNR